MDLGKAIEAAYAADAAYVEAYRAAGFASRWDITEADKKALPALRLAPGV